MNEQDGGAAFPLPFALNPQNGNVNNFEEYGMTLRDYFAAKAIPLCVGRWPTYEEDAKAAYAIADAMILARQLKQSGETK